MEDRENRKRLIVGLGNPGDEYEGTRHNIGFDVVRSFAKELGVTFFKEKTLISEFAKTVLQGDTVLFLLPLTYMNDSGVAVKRCMDFFKISVKGVLVVVDDIELSFKTLRIRPRGRSGGHNGLQSIEDRLGTVEYSRLKIGVGHPKTQSVADYVLDKFTNEEQKDKAAVISAAHDFIRSWLEKAESSFTKDLQIQEVNKNNP